MTFHQATTFTAFKKYMRFFAIVNILMIWISCSPIKNSQYQEYLSLRYEQAECLTNYSYSNSTKITGTAKFYKRGINLVVQNSQLQNMTLGDPLTAPLPIKYAEVAVYNSINKIVQCGLTDSNGDLKAVDGVSNLTIPASAGQYTVRVFSRSNVILSYSGKPSFNFHVAIKKDIYTNELYNVSSSAVSNGIDDLNNFDVIAYARQTDSMGVEGGAFNILNSIFTAYDYIRSNTGTIDTTCLSEKLNVYWKLGFNPFQYTYPNQDPSNLTSGSFYDKTTKNLYITGGKLGDITIDVTNHFDDFVIIHELGHHIENQCGQLTTPGGTHAIIVRIDPRLAWSEGWANFFAEQVMFNSINSINTEVGAKLTAAGFSSNWTYLFASKGFSDSVQNIGNGSGFMFDMKKAGNNPDTWQYGAYQGFMFDKIDATRYPGEGHFREGAISRGLFKLANHCEGSCLASSDTTISFQNIWQSMDRITGAGQTTYPFKSSHTVLEILKSIVGSSTWTTNYKTFNESTTSEALHLFSDGIFTSGGINRWMPYGTYLNTVTSGACSAGQFYIEPRSDDPSLTGTNSDQRYSNHYYTIDLNTLSGVDEINVNFTKQNSSGTNTEFDILLFKQDYFFNGDYACSTTDSSGNCSAYTPSRTTTFDVLRSDRRSGSVSTKTIKTLQSLDHGQRYLLNIRAYTPNKSLSSVTDYSYTITDQNGANICP